MSVLVHEICHAIQLHTRFKDDPMKFNDFYLYSFENMWLLESEAVFFQNIFYRRFYSKDYGNCYYNKSLYKSWYKKHFNKFK